MNNEGSKSAGEYSARGEENESQVMSKGNHEDFKSHCGNAGRQAAEHK